LTVLHSYTASKAALLGLNNCLCVRAYSYRDKCKVISSAGHARDGIRVNGVAPGVSTSFGTVATSSLIFGPVETPMFKPEYRESYKLDKIPAGRFGKPREVYAPDRSSLAWSQPRARAEVVLFLCSPRSSFVNGAMIPIDGGMNSL
jgi:NAD(P)-dependent dehydrogenase (short-subunit alcohol dehydrogenase family)